MKKNPMLKMRDGNKLMHLRGEINLSTRSESLERKKYTRNKKHKKSAECWNESFKKIDSNTLLEAMAY